MRPPLSGLERELLQAPERGFRQRRGAASAAQREVRAERTLFAVNAGAQRGNVNIFLEGPKFVQTSCKTGPDHTRARNVRETAKRLQPSQVSGKGSDRLLLPLAAKFERDMHEGRSYPAHVRGFAAACVYPPEQYFLVFIRYGYTDEDAQEPACQRWDSGAHQFSFPSINESISLTEADRTSPRPPLK